MNFGLIGLILMVLGAFVLCFNNLFTGFHQRVYRQKWNKRYWWIGWRPFYKNSQTLKWQINWNHRVVVEGFFPPKYFLEILGFLLILSGTILQILHYFK